MLRLILRILGFIVRSILIDMFYEFCYGNDFFPDFFFFFFLVFCMELYRNDVETDSGL